MLEEKGVVCYARDAKCIRPRPDSNHKVVVGNGIPVSLVGVAGTAARDCTLAVDHLFLCVDAIAPAQMKMTFVAKACRERKGKEGKKRIQ